MPPKGGRKRAASTGAQQAKVAKAPRPEPTRTSRRLRSTSPANQSPLRALSPPTKKRTRRKPKPIPEEAEEQQEEKAEAGPDSQDSSQLQDKTDNEKIIESQDSNVNNASNGDTDLGDNEYGNENNSETGAHDEPESIHLSTEHSDVDEHAAHAPETLSLSNEQSSNNEELLEHAMTQETPENVDQPESLSTTVQAPADHSAESESETANAPVDVQTTGNQLYTSKNVFCLAAKDQTPCISSTSSVEHSMNPSASQCTPFAATPTSGNAGKSSVTISETLQNAINSPTHRTVSEWESLVHQLRRDLKNERHKRAFFEAKSDFLSYITRDLRTLLRSAILKANSHEVQSQASQKIIESLQIKSQKLRQGELDDTTTARNEYATSRKRSAPISEFSSRESDPHPPRRIKVSHEQKPNQEMSSSQQTGSAENASTEPPLSTENLNVSAVASYPTDSGAYLMSGALDSPRHMTEASHAVSNVGTNDRQTPETPITSSWSKIFNPVASVRRIFGQGATPRTEPVRRADPVDHATIPEPTRDDVAPVAPTSSDLTDLWDILPRPRDAFGIPRQRRHINFKSTPVGGLFSTQQRTQEVDPDSLHRVPGSFVLDEDPITPLPPQKPELPRHSFMPLTAPQPRRGQTGLQRRLQHERELANAEAAAAAEEKARQEKEEIAEMERIRREALRARSLNIPPEAIRASFVEKFGASAREIQEQQDKGLQTGMKRKARAISPEQIPNPPGCSYGLNDDYFDDDESQEGESNVEADEHGRPFTDSTNSAANLENSTSFTPTRPSDHSSGSTTDSPNFISRLFGSLSRSAKRPRLDDESVSSNSAIVRTPVETTNNAFEDMDDETPTDRNSRRSPSERRAKEYYSNSSSLPPLRFRRDAVTGQLEPIKARDGAGFRNNESQNQSLNTSVAPWYSGPFAPPKRNTGSPSDQLFSSPSVLNMKHRHEYRGDFISEPLRHGNTIDSGRNYYNIDDDEENFEESANQSSTLMSANYTSESTNTSAPDDVSNAIVYGQKYGCWTGPKGTGQFAVPESDSEEDDEEDEASQLTPRPTSLTQADLIARSSEDSVHGTANIFSMSRTETAEATPKGDSQTPVSQEPASQEPVPPIITDTPTASATPTSKDTDALARARSQAEKYKPKTPSTLRAISAMPSPLSAQSQQHGVARVDDDESGEEVGPITPGLSPTGPITDPSMETGDDINYEQSIEYAQELARKIPVEDLPVDHTPWPRGTTPPWAHLIDEQVSAALEADRNSSDFEARADEAWRVAWESWKEENAAGAA